MTSKREATSPAVAYDNSSISDDIENMKTIMSSCASSIKKLRLFESDEVNDNEDSNTSSQTSCVSQDANLSNITLLTNISVHLDHALLTDGTSHSDVSENLLHTSYNDSEHENLSFSSITTKQTQTDRMITRTVETQTIFTMSTFNQQDIPINLHTIYDENSQTPINTIFSTEPDISLNYPHDYITDDELTEFFRSISN